MKNRPRPGIWKIVSTTKEPVISPAGGGAEIRYRGGDGVAQDVPEEYARLSRPLGSRGADIGHLHLRADGIAR